MVIFLLHHGKSQSQGDHGSVKQLAENASRLRVPSITLSPESSAHTADDLRWSRGSGGAEVRSKTPGRTPQSEEDRGVLPGDLHGDYKTNEQIKR